MISRTTSTTMQIISTANFSKVITYTIISFIINNILFIANSIKIASQYDSFASIAYYVTMSFVTRSFIHALLIVIILKLIPINIQYDGRCPNCNSKLSMQRYVFQGNIEQNCTVCKKTVKLYKYKFVCTN